MRKIIFIITLLFVFISNTFAQMNGPAQPAGEESIMTGDGKIYVVLGVCLIIFAGLVAYLFLLDRRISRMEQKKD